MDRERRVIVFEDRDALVAGVAERFFDLVTGLLAAQDAVHLVLTGGTVGGDVLAAIGASDRLESVDWSRVGLWWGDERWLPAGDAERSDAQSEESFLSRPVVARAAIHRIPASDGRLDLDAAAAEYAAELAQAAGDGERMPAFDLVFLGVGPDAHIASLFPGHDEIRVTESTVLPVRNSPKPPPERVSLTLPALNSAARIWLCLSGADKASALGLALAGANASEVPAAGAEGRLETVFLVDRDATAEVPQELLG
jgi:6-phosphogluconolactonase